MPGKEYSYGKPNYSPLYYLKYNGTAATVGGVTGECTSMISLNTFSLTKHWSTLR